MDCPLGFNIKNNTFKELISKLPLMLAIDVWYIRNKCNNWSNLVVGLELSEENYIILHEQYGLPYPTPLNINKCSYIELLSVPEMSSIRARSILLNRPFTNPMDIANKIISNDLALKSKHIKYFTFGENKSVVNIKSNYIRDD